MKKRAKNFVRLVALSLTVLVLSSCGGCNFAELFNIVLPEETEESGTPITPDGSYTNSEAQSGLIDDNTEEPTEEVIVQYNAAVERQIQTDYCEEFMNSYVKTPEVQFLGKFGNAYAVYVLDTTMRGRTGAYFVEGYEFRYFAERQVYLYQGGVFTTLQNALAAKLITTDDLAIIHSKFKELNYEEYKFITEDDPRVIIGTLGRITVMIQPAFNDKEYTPEDFSDIGCTSIKESEYSIGEPHEIYRRMQLFFEPVNDREELMAKVKQLEARKDIYSASPAYEATLDSLPNDSEYVASNNDYWAINKINLPAAWEVQSGNATVLVGIIDTGIDGSHPDLQSRVNTSLSKCFSDDYDEDEGLEDVHGHGTAVAGIIGAQANNTIGVFGVCQSASLVSLRANFANGNLDYDAVAEAINHAELNGIDIINLSAGVTSYAINVKTAINNYSGLVVCSAGNAGWNIDDINEEIYEYYPANWGQDNVLVVGSSTSDDRIDDVGLCSNYGVSSVDLFAPGVNILTTYPLDFQKDCECGFDHTVYSAGYYHFQNTSAATPFVAGVAALILAQEPTLDPIYAKIRIMTYVDIVSNFEGKCTTSGRLNAFRAVHGSCVYNDSYSLYEKNKAFHKAYCACGDFLYERHKGSPSCTKCGYSG
ncbi:MAG: S8 family serine peptidase [Clostridia bacterium]|nr:S8 family serine peptidase [Clostridia bacterium]